MKEATITVTIGENESMRIEAYLSSTEGLAIHRQVSYLPGKEEHKFTSKWQVTHQPSGMGLLTPSACLPTMKDAVAIAEQLGAYDWEAENPFDDETRRLVSRTLEEALAKHVPDEGSIEVRYVVRRNHEGPGYVIVDTATDQVHEVVVHRGMASAKAQELNGSVST